MLRRWTLSAAWTAAACLAALGLTLAAGSPPPRPALAAQAAPPAHTLTLAGSAPAVPSAPGAAAPPTPPAPDWEEREARGPHRPASRAPAPAERGRDENRASYRIASRGGAAADRLMASWYGAEFQGLSTASGEPFDRLGLTAAHRTLPMGTRLVLTNPQNGRSVEVRVNDRGPFVAGRDIDLSEAAFAAIAPLNAGVVPVRVQVSP
ncbi:MAG: septal ring lytic transglycosylase RlpA family protein [Bacillota bacterium]